MAYTVPSTINSTNYPFIANPNRPFYTSRNLPILLFVNHITVGATDLVAPDTSIEATISWAKNAPNTSWHGGVDSDSIRNTLPDTYTAWHAGLSGHSFNSPTIGLEVGLNSTDWRKLPSAHRDKIVRNMAIFWAPRVIRWGIPIRYEFSRNQIDYRIARREKIGFTDHKVLNPDNRRDPGWVSLTTNTFPVDQFLNEVRAQVAALKGGTAPPPAPAPTPIPTNGALTIDGKLGPATITRWQKVMGTTPDGYITADGSALVAAVQRFLNAQPGVTDRNGRDLVVDGKGILPNLSRDYGPTNTVWALQDYLQTTKDGILSHPESSAVRALQGRLNKAVVGSKKF